MRVVDSFPARGFFDGTRTLTLRSLPPGARLKSARLVLSPIADDQGAIGATTENLSFLDTQGLPISQARDTQTPGRQTGVTRSSGFGPPRWTEIAFSGFRTLQSISGNGLAGARLQVDLGGIFVEVDTNGTVPAQGSVFSLPGNVADLPGLSVQRIRLVGADNSAPTPDVTSITLRSVPTNLAVAFGSQPAVWAHPGETAGRIETRNLAEFLQAALTDAPVEGGFATLPITVRSDSPARLDVEVATEFDATTSALPSGLGEATLEYAHDATADAGDDLLRVDVPDGMELDPDQTHVEIAGSFEGSQVVFGPLAERTPAGSIEIAEGHAVAAPLGVPSETVTDAVDVLLSTQRRNARVEIDLREDFDGKPGDVSLLTTRAKGALDVARFAAPRWLSAALGQEVTLPPADQGTGKPRIWVVVQAVAGPVAWHLNTTESASAELQTSETGGLSWRPARVEGISEALDARLRLRRATRVFQVPLSAEVGRGEAARHVSLARFQPLGRVEFALDSADFAGALNAHLGDRRKDACPRGVQIRNGDFTDRNEGEFYAPRDWLVSTGTLTRQSFQVSGLPDGTSLLLIAIGSESGPAQSISQIIPVSSGCPYALSFRGFRFRSLGARVEVIWRGDACDVIGIDTLEPPHPRFSQAAGPIFSHVGATGPLQTIPSAALNLTAPEGATQAELRLVAPADEVLWVDAVGLAGGHETLQNGDLRAFDPATPEVDVPVGWTVLPEDHARDRSMTVDADFGGLTMTNQSPIGRSLTLSQRVPISAGTPVSVAAEAVIPTAFISGPAPVLGALWLDGAGQRVGTPLAAALRPDAAQIARLSGTAPEGTTEAEIRIELPAGAGLELAAVALETPRPDAVPVSFLSEAPGRLTVRDFTVGFRPAPAPTPPAFTATPCAPTPADRAPGDVCEPDPCCKDRMGPDTVRAQLTLSDSLANTTITAATTGTSLAGRTLSAVTATATISEIATRRARFALREIEITPRAVATLALPVAEVNGVGPVRTRELATLGIATVGELARANEEELVRRLDYHPDLARDIVARAIELERDAIE